ncbi:11270_t:CDS:2 [Entrophospora sp. SA101]|nr:11270_t:CDS:2 [Entrophospora sp. SA101]
MTTRKNKLSDNGCFRSSGICLYSLSYEKNAGKIDNKTTARSSSQNGRGQINYQRGTGRATMEKNNSAYPPISQKKNKDHREIAKELDLYILDDKAGQVVIRNQIQNFLQKKQQELDFQEVITPILGSEYLYQTSGHLDHYQDSMFPAISRDNETFYLRPMTCPHHCLIYRQKPRSYPDHHIFVSSEQLKEELKKNYRYIADILAAFNFPISRLVYTLISVLNELKLNYVILKGEAAFYGPKLDLEITAADGKNITISTIQLDFILPQKFGLNYIDAKQNLKTTAIIHHSPIGTYQPPCQLAILPLNEEEEVKKYCEEIKKELIKVIGESEVKKKVLKLIHAYYQGQEEELSEKDLYNKLTKEKII